jgi:hypothetical protein
MYSKRMMIPQQYRHLDQTVAVVSAESEVIFSKKRSLNAYTGQGLQAHSKVALRKLPLRLFNDCPA